MISLLRLHVNRGVVLLLVTVSIVFFISKLTHTPYFIFPKDTEILESLDSTTAHNAPESVQQDSYKNTELTISKKLSLSALNVYTLVNNERKIHNLEPLEISESLTQSSLSKSGNMFDNQYFSHNDLQGRNFSYFVDNTSFDYIKISENLAMGDFDSAQDVVDAWMKSSGHRKNILDPVYTVTGITVESGYMFGKKTYIIVQHFGKSRLACPAIDNGLKNSIADMTKAGVMLYKEIENLDREIGKVTDNSVINIFEKELKNKKDTYNKMVDNLAVMVEKYNNQVTNFEKCRN